MGKIDKPRNTNTWTEARYRAFIVSGLRKITFRWGPKVEAKKLARHPNKFHNANGRLVFHSICKLCQNVIPETESTVDHIEPVIDPATGFKSWDEYIERLFCEADGFQVLCRACHDQKTYSERKVSTERKRRLKSVI